MELRPCPVCGAEVEVDLGSGVYAYLSCPTREWRSGRAETSHSLVVMAPTLEEAARAWNGLSPHPASVGIEGGPDGPDAAPVGSAVAARGQGAVVSDQGLTGRFGPDGPDGPKIAGFPVCARGDGG